MRILSIIGVATILSLAAGALAEDGPKPLIPLDAETTFFKGPLKADGTVDYVAALDNLQKRGITAENNVVIPLLKIIGTGDALSPEVRAETLKRLGLDEQKGLGNYKNSVSPAVCQQAQEELSAFLNGKTAKHALVDAWLQADDAAITLFIEASKRDRYYLPRLSSDGSVVNIQLPALGAIRNYCNLLMVRTKARIGAGDVDGAITDLLAAHRVARVSCQGGTSIEYLVASAMEELASTVDGVLVASGKLSTTQASEYLAKLDAMPVRPDPYSLIHVSERCMALDGAMTARRTGIKEILAKAPKTVTQAQAEAILDPIMPTVLRDINKTYDQLVRAARQSDAAQRQVMFSQIYRERDAAIAAAPRSPKTPEESAAYLSAHVQKIFTPAMDVLIGHALASQQSFELARVSLALAAYHADKGDYPEALNALTPGYLKEITPDRFAAGPLKYQKRGKGFVLYSVGRNLKDDGGTPSTSGKNTEGDIVLTSDR